MSMNRLLVKGGYGEHGRSCFLLPMGEDRYCMLDCGIMDTGIPMASINSLDHSLLFISKIPPIFPAEE